MVSLVSIISARQFCCVVNYAWLLICIVVGTKYWQYNNTQQNLALPNTVFCHVIMLTTLPGLIFPTLHNKFLQQSKNLWQLLNLSAWDEVEDHILASFLKYKCHNFVFFDVWKLMLQRFLKEIQFLLLFHNGNCFLLHCIRYGRTQVFTDPYSPI